MHKALKHFFLFLIGGIIYHYIEMLWRGYSHPTMFFLGGLCFLAIGGINEFIPWDMGLLWQSIIGACLVTALEFITGIIVNIWLGLGVWDYSKLPFNILGQICLPFFFAWMAVSVIAIVLDDYLRYWLFGEEKPYYKLF